MHFVNDVLPFFAGLPCLTSFTCMVWRDRNWSPDFLGHIATHLPNLEELAVGVENSGLNWWPGSMVSRPFRVSVHVADAVMEYRVNTELS